MVGTRRPSYESAPPLAVAEAEILGTRQQILAVLRLQRGIRRWRMQCREHGAAAYIQSIHRGRAVRQPRSSPPLEAAAAQLAIDTDESEGEDEEAPFTIRNLDTGEATSLKLGDAPEVCAHRRAGPARTRAHARARARAHARERNIRTHSPHGGPGARARAPRYTAHSSPPLHAPRPPARAAPRS